MPAPVMQVEGARQLRAALKRAQVSVADLKDVHAAVAQVVVVAARPLAPVLTGRLAGSIRGNKAQGSAVVSAGRASIPYAGPIHWGWPARHIRPQPFLADAAAGTRPVWEQQYFDALEAIIARLD